MEQLPRTQDMRSMEALVAHSAVTIAKCRLFLDSLQKGMPLVKLSIVRSMETLSRTQDALHGCSRDAVTLSRAQSLVYSWTAGKGRDQMDAADLHLISTSVWRVRVTSVSSAPLLDEYK